MNREQFFGQLATFDEKRLKKGSLESVLARLSSHPGTH
jgi:single-stranded DNA-binding protein